MERYKNNETQTTDQSNSICVDLPPIANQIQPTYKAHVTSDQLTTPRQVEPDLPHVVIVGAGFGGLDAAKHLGKLPVKVTILDRNNFTLFQPMLYQVATAGLDAPDIAAPIREILKHQQNTTTLQANVIGIDTKQQKVKLEEGPDLAYDYLILATGAYSNYFHHPEWQRLAPSMKSIADATSIRSMLLGSLEKAELEPDNKKMREMATIVLVGGGPTGVELAGSIAELMKTTLLHQFKRVHPEMIRIILIQGGKRILDSFSTKIARQAAGRLRELGVEIRVGKHVTKVQEDGVWIGDEFVAASNVIWTAGVKASTAGEWIHATTDSDGRIKVNRDLSVPEHPNIFAIGDTALFIQNGKPLPGLAPVAIQSAVHVADVIKARIYGDDSPKPFVYTDKGNMAIVGRGYAIVESGPLHVTGFLAWIMLIGLHIFYLINFRNRISVMAQYAWNYLTFQRTNRLIYPQTFPRPLE